MERIGQALHSSTSILTQAYNFYKKARDYQKQGDPEKANECYLEAIDLAKKEYQPNKSKVSQDLAVLYFHYGCFLEAEEKKDDRLTAKEAYQQAHKYIWNANSLTPNQPEVQNLCKDIGLQYSRSLLTQGETDQADKVFDSVVQPPTPYAAPSSSISKYFSLPSPKRIPYKRDADQGSVLFRIKNSEFEKRLDRLKSGTTPTQQQSPPPAPQADYASPKRGEPIQETRHLAWCIQDSNASKEDKKIWKQKAEQLIKPFKDGNKNLAHIQEIVALGSIDHPQLHRDLTNALLDALKPEKNRFLNLFLLRGISVMVLHRCLHLTDDLNVAADCVALVQALLPLLKNIHVYNNKEQTITLLQTISLVVDGALSRNVQGVDRVGFELPLLDALKRFDSEKKYPELAGLINYIKQMLMHLPNDETSIEELARRMKTGAKCALYVTDLVLGAVGTHGVALVAAIIHPDKILSIGSSFKETFSGIKCLKRAHWYEELRSIDKGDFNSLETLLKDKQRKWEEPLLRCLCDRLERLAWDSTAQGDSALKLLQGLERGKLEEAKYPSSIQQYARQSLNRLALTWPSPDFDRMDQYGYAPPPWHPFWSAKPKGELWESISVPITSTDLRRALKERYAARLDDKEDQAFQETLQLYVEQRCRIQRQNKVEPFPLLSTVQDLLFKDKKQVILVTGDVGVGKTTFSRMLEKQLWEWEHREENQPIPLLICLPSIDKPKHNLIDKALKQRGFSESQIQKLKQGQKFVFIFDGYDEIHQTQNLYLSNQINQSGNWQGSIVITCGSEYLGQNYRHRFQPNDKGTSFQEVVIEPFSDEDQYLTEYVKYHPTDWTAQDYKAEIKKWNLKGFVGNPFLLRVALDALPRLGNDEETRTDIQLRMDLYDEFIRRKFEGSQERLSAQDLTEGKKELFKKLCDDGFAEHGLRFVQDLAVHVYTENGGDPTIEYSLYKDEGTWKDSFFGHEDKLHLLRDAWPLIRSGNQYRFIHKSLLEYFAARALFKSFDACMVPKTRSRRGSDASVYSFENQPTLALPTQQDVSLAPKHWVNDVGVIRWLTERVEQEPTFKDQLLTIIERSKTDAEVRQAAANAITILVKAGTQFHGADFKGIQTPGADLSYGFFEGTQFQSISKGQPTDLRKVCLQGALLRGTDFSGAIMQGVQFGELPSLHFDSTVIACCYSSHGLAIAQSDSISLYDPHSLQEEPYVTWHKKIAKVTSVALSSDGRYVVSGSEDTKVRIWDLLERKNTEPHILEGHSKAVISVALSSDGRYVVSGSKDKTIRVWERLEMDYAEPSILNGHEGEVTSIALSPDGRYVISGSDDAKVRMWDLLERKNAEPSILQKHSKAVISVALSPDGRYVVSGSEDRTVQVYDLDKSDVLTLKGQYKVTSVALSPDGHYVVFGSKDKIVRVWNSQEQDADAKPRILAGHNRQVTSVALSSDGRYVVSGSGDKTVRVWDLHTLSRTFNNLPGHERGVSSVALSPDGRYIVSKSKDKRMWVWDLRASNAKCHISKHDIVSNIVLLQDGRYIVASNKGKSLQVWDLGTPSSDISLHSLVRDDNDEDGWVTSVALSSDGRYVAFGSTKEIVRVWDLKTSELHTLEGHTDGITSIGLSTDGQYVVSGSKDKTVRVWERRERGYAELSILNGHTEKVTSVALSPDGRYVVSGCQDKSVRVWERHEKSYAEPRVLEGHQGKATSIVLSPDGQYFASNNTDETVQIWDIASGQCLTTIENFNECVHALDRKKFGDLDYLVTGSGDKTVRWWQLIKEDGRWRAMLRGASTQQSLTLSEANIEGVQGLSPTNKRLLEERGAKGKPAPNPRPLTQPTQGLRQLC